MLVKPLSIKPLGANQNTFMIKENYLVNGFRYGIGNTDGSRNIVFWDTESGGTLYLTSGSNWLTIGSFSNVIFTYDATTQTAKVFMDDVEVGSLVGTYSPATDKTLYISGNCCGTGGTNSVIDEIKVYDYALR